MNIALPALVVFVLLLPGFVARSRFKRWERTSLDYSPFGQVVTEAIIWAAALHGVWIGIVTWATPYTVEPEQILRLVSSDSHAQLQAIESVSKRAHFVASYFGSLLVFAIAGPTAFRWATVRSRWDRIGMPLSAAFRFSGSPWYYLLTGADFAEDDVPDLISVSAAVNIAGEAYLFKGFLDEYFVDREGSLDRLVLSDVERRPLEKDKTFHNAEADMKRFYPIDGDYFVLRYSEIITLNVKYIKLKAEPAETSTASPVEVSLPLASSA